VKLLELPEQAQRMLGAGTIPLSAVDQLRTIGEVSPQLLDAALRDARSGVFAAHLTRLDSHAIAGLKLGTKAEALLEEATRLHKQIDRYAYGAPQVRFGDTEVDQARAAGVIIEFDASAPVIVDRPVYRELCKQAIKRTVEELRAAADTAARERTATKAAGQPEDPEAQARREKGRALRALAEQAHGANLDLGWALRNELSSVEIDMTVARLLVYGLLGADYDGSPYTQSGNRVAELATRGIRLVVDEFRTDVTKTKKDGSRGAMRTRRPRWRSERAARSACASATTVDSPTRSGSASTAGATASALVPTAMGGPIEKPSASWRMSSRRFELACGSPRHQPAARRSAT
jgi:hypothetical protein